jgi:hypothetical protein
MEILGSTWFIGDLQFDFARPACAESIALMHSA